MADLTKKAKEGLETAGSFLGNLPIIKDYQDKERRREADRKVREALSVSLEASRKRVVKIERTLLNKGKLTSLPYVDEAAGRLQTLVDRIKTAPSGYAGFFAADKIREPELEKIQKFDERIAASIPQINERIDAVNQTVEAGEDFSQPLVDLIKDLDALGERLDHRKEAIRAAGDETALLPAASTAPAETPATPDSNTDD